MAIAGIPRTTAWVDAARKIAREADQWLQSVIAAVNSAAQQIGSADVTVASAATLTTAIPTPVLSSGLYRVSYSLRVITPASVSSSLTPTITWTSNGASCSQSGVALTGNTTATQQNATFVVDVDTSTTIRYAVAYSSTGTAMTYTFNVLAEALP